MMTTTRNFLIIFTFSVFLFACKKTDRLDSNKSQATVENLSKDNLFINYVGITDEIIQKINKSPKQNKHDQEEVGKYINKQQITSEHLNEIALDLGFTGSADLLASLKKQDATVEALQKKYIMLSTIPISIIEESIAIIHGNNAALPIKLNLADLCERTYKNCNAQASAVYSAEILGCTGAAIGVGAATAGIGGILFQLGCGGIAMYHLKTMREGCDLASEACQSKNTSQNVN